MDLKNFIVYDDSDSEASYVPSDTETSDGESETYQDPEIEDGYVRMEISQDSIPSVTVAFDGSIDSVFSDQWKHYITDPFTGDPLPSGIMPGEKVDKIVSSHFCPNARARYFQVVWIPRYSWQQHPDTYPNATWCTYDQLKTSRLLSDVTDEDGKTMENYCFKNQDEYKFYLAAEYAAKEDGDDGYIDKGRCNALIWNEKSQLFNQRCHHSTMVSKNSTNYIPYCAHHHHAMHAPDDIDRKRFYRGQWFDLTIMV